MTDPFLNEWEMNNVSEAKTMNNCAHECDMEEFYRVFGADANAHTAGAYDVYIKGAENVWRLYSSKYEMRPRSKANARKGKNPGVEIYRADEHLVGFSVQLNSVKLYVHDSNIRLRLPLDYHVDPSGKYWARMKDIDEALDAVKDLL